MRKNLFHLIQIGIIASIFAIITSFSGDDPLPIDPKVKIGKLDNGLTYYIIQNKKPEKRVYLRLAVSAGSVQEDDDQLGMAHFVEHMCFNGTANFPKNDLIHYLQSVGVNFGPEINGYTSFNETVYILTLPSDSTSIVDNGFKIMADWAHAVTFDTTEIRKERGVILEEWRRGLGSGQRMRDKYLPVLLNGSKYAERLPIGTRESIENSTPESIVRFYNDWYKPELMAFVVVGDIDPDSIETKIKNEFGPIPKTDHLRKKEEYKVPDNNDPLISIVSDKENSRVSMTIAYKKEAKPFRTFDDYENNISKNIFCSMLNQRLYEISRKADPPFISAGVSYGNLWVKTCEGFNISLSVAENEIKKGLIAVLTEIERVKRYGFTQAELERIKKNIRSNVENSYKERDKIYSGNMVNKCVSNFLNDYPILGIEFQYDFIKNNIDGFKLDEINKLTKQFITDSNQIIIYQGIDKEGLIQPTEKELMDIIASVSNLEIEPYKEKELPDNLMKNPPEPGKIIAEKKVGTKDITELKLSNGITVVLKPTDFQNNQIIMKGFSKKGCSVFPEGYKLSYWFATPVVSQSGAGDFSRVDMNKILTGKRVSFSPGISENSSQLSGSSSVADIETMLQLCYLYFTQPRFDEDIYTSIVSKNKAAFKNSLSNPLNYYSNQIQYILYNNNPLISGTYPTEKDWNDLNLEKIKEVYRNSFSNAADFTFAFIGSFNIEEIKPLIETYLGRLPVTGAAAGYYDNGLRPEQGPIDTVIYKGSDPKSFVTLKFNGPAEWNKVNSHVFWSLGNILNKIYIDKLREEMSGVYSIGVNSYLEPMPYHHYSLTIQIPCSPENADKLTNAALDEIKRIITEGPTEEEVNNEKESQRRSEEKNNEENNSWMFRIERVYTVENDDLGRIENPFELCEMLTPELIKEVASKYLDPSKYVRITLMPELKSEQKNTPD